MLARPGDHILIDVLAHACLQEGAQASGAKVHRFPHLSLDGVKRRRLAIRKDEPAAGILVVTETLFSMDSDTPDLTALQASVRKLARLYSLIALTILAVWDEADLAFLPTNRWSAR